jgi:hypothetical protein
MWTHTYAAEHRAKHMQTVPPYLKFPSILFGDNVKPGIALTRGGPSTSQEWMRSIFSLYSKPIVTILVVQFSLLVAGMWGNKGATPHNWKPIICSPQKSFTAWYRRKEKPSINELEEYFKLPAEDFNACNPIQWWMGWRAQFPYLFHLACDILCIPGELFLHLHARFCYSCRVGLLRRSRHQFPLLCKPPCWYHPDSTAG